MNSVQAALFARVDGDLVIRGILGGSGRFTHQIESQTPSEPCMRFMNFQNLPGNPMTDRVLAEEQVFVFTIFSGRATEIERRLKMLLHNYVFAATADADGLRVRWDSTGPDLFDEPLQVERKDVRFRVEVIPLATAPI